MKPRFAVIGAGPLGSCAAYAISEFLDATDAPGEVLLVDANDPLQQHFHAMSAAGPHAAGQLMLHVFDNDSPAKALTRRSHRLLRGIQQAGQVNLHPRPWICCAGNSGSELDEVTQEILTQAFNEGRFKGCKLVSGDKIPEAVGLRRDQVGLALLDETTMAVNPRTFVTQLARRAVEDERVTAEFNTRVIALDGGTLTLEYAGTMRDVSVDGVVLCTGIHRDLCTNALPPSRPEFLHVTEHASPDHEPEVINLITGETTIARYAGFGPNRTRITELLHEDIRSKGIHALYTVVPSLRRMLDSHYPDLNEADADSERVWELLRDVTGRYVDSKYLLDTDTSDKNANASYVAAYTKLLESDGPWLDFVENGVPTVYAQPSNGLGLNQCAALGEDAARMLLS